MDGYEAVPRIRRYEKKNRMPASKIIVVTALQSEAAHAEAFGSGFDVFFEQADKTERPSETDSRRVMDFRSCQHEINRDEQISPRKNPLRVTQWSRLRGLCTVACPKAPNAVTLRFPLVTETVGSRRPMKPAVAADQ